MVMRIRLNLETMNASLNEGKICSKFIFAGQFPLPITWLFYQVKNHRLLSTLSPSYALRILLCSSSNRHIASARQVSSLVRGSCALNHFLVSTGTKIPNSPNSGYRFFFPTRSNQSQDFTRTCITNLSIQ